MSEPAPQGPDGRTPTPWLWPHGRPRTPWLSSRGRAAAAVLALAAATGASSLGTWVYGAVEGPLGGIGVMVSGATAAPVVPATALVLAAAGAAVALAGRLGRWVVVVVVALGGLAVVGGAVGVIVRPETAATAVAAAQTGIGRLRGAPAVSSGPWVALVVGVLVVVTAGLLARASAWWSAPNARHEVAGRTAPAAEAPDERSDWDALTRGADPSDGP
jgi:hypothetical protein